MKSRFYNSYPFVKFPKGEEQSLQTAGISGLASWSSSSLPSRSGGMPIPASSSCSTPKPSKQDEVAAGSEKQANA